MKEYRYKELTWLATFYSLLFLILSTDMFNNVALMDNTSQFILDLLKTICISCIIPLFAFLADCILSTDTKDKILGLFFIRKTGEVVFSRIKNGKFKDNRIDSKTVANKYKEIIDGLPTGSKQKHKYENENWYKIYKRNSDVGSVVQSQKDYLVCRDMFIQSVLIIPVYILSVFVLKNVHFSIEYIVTVLLMSTFINVAAHNKMKRFVFTVIVRDALSDENDKEV